MPGSEAYPVRNGDPSDSPAREAFLPLHRPWIDDDDVRAVTGILRRDPAAVAEKTAELERAFATYVEATYVVAVASGAAALQLALDVLGVEPGDEVILSVCSRPSVVAAVLQRRGRPVLTDVVADTLTMDFSLLDGKISARTRAIVPVHLGGFPCDLDPILDVAARHQIGVVEDASQALPARRNGRMVGSGGALGVFNLATATPMAAAGMVTTDERSRADRLRLTRSHGITGIRGTSGPVHEVVFHDSGFELTGVNAVLGAEHLRKADMFHAIRNYYAALYQLGLSDLPELTLPEVPPSVEHAWHHYMIRLNLDLLRVDREGFLAELRAENIEAGYCLPLHLHPHYRNALGHAAGDFPRALAAYRQVISLPLYPSMTEGDVWDVIRAVRNVVERYRVTRR